MNEQQVRKIIQQELYKANNASRFNGVTAVVDHIHNGVDSPKIKAENVIPSVSVSGSITFSQQTRYTINLNSSFTPSFILAYGIVTDGTVRAQTIGSASLTPSFYLQPNTDTSVITGNIQYPFPTTLRDGTTAEVPVQSSSYIATGTGSPSSRALVSEGHIVSIEYGGTIYARATVIEYSKTKIVIDVPYLSAGWNIIVNYVIS